MMTTYLLQLHLIALILTIVFEVLFACICGYHNRQTLKVVVLAQVVTNPVVVLLANLCLFYTVWPVAVYLIPLEISAVIVEWQIYRLRAKQIARPLVFSLAANVFSYTIGFGIQELGFYDLLEQFVMIR